VLGQIFEEQPIHIAETQRINDNLHIRSGYRRAVQNKFVSLQQMPKESSAIEIEYKLDMQLVDLCINTECDNHPPGAQADAGQFIQKLLVS
jgi:hypothetical protein